MLLFTCSNICGAIPPTSKTLGGLAGFGTGNKAGLVVLSRDFSAGFSFDSSLLTMAAACTAYIVSTRMDEGWLPMTGDTECYLVSLWAVAMPYIVLLAALACNSFY